MTIVCERVAGLAIIILIFSGAYFLQPIRFLSSSSTSLDKPILLAGCLFVLVFFAVILTLKLLRKSKALNIDIHEILIKWKVKIALVIGLSVITQFITFTVFYRIMVASGYTGSFLETVGIIAVIKIVSALPISIGGWGVREVTTLTLFTLNLGISPESSLAVSITYGLALLLFAIPGAFIFLFWRSR